MEWIEQIFDVIPENYAEDLKSNFEKFVRNNSLGQTLTTHIALAAAYSTKNSNLISTISMHSKDSVQKKAAMTAVSILAQHDIWHNYINYTEDARMKEIDSQFKLSAVRSYGGTTKSNYAAFSLAYSIVEKCNLCIKTNYNILIDENYSTEQLADIGRVSAIINATGKILNAAPSNFPKPVYL